MRLLSRFLSFGGVLATVSLYAVLHATSFAPESYDPLGTFRLPWVASFALASVLAAYALGLPENPPSRRSAMFSAVLSIAVPVGLISLTQLALGTPLLPRSVVLLSGITIVPLQVMAWNVSGDGRRAESQRERVILVASPDAAAALIADMDAELERPFSLSEVLTPGSARQTANGRRPLEEAAEQADSTLIVLDVSAQAEPTIVSQAADLHQQGLRVRTLSLFTEEFLGKLPIGELEQVSLLFDIGELHRIRYNRIKRLVDILVGIAGMVVLAPVTLLVLLGNAVGNRGPLFYRQIRVGKGGEPFTILKFRSMVPSDGPTSWTAEDDERITRFGRLLRQSHVDELPQMVNIIRGDLSIVGPRPEQPHYVDELRQKIVFYDVRHLVRPGLSGWAQVKYRYGSTEQDAFEKLQYEFFYLRRQGLGLDVRIMSRTLRRVFGRQGR